MRPNGSTRRAALSCALLLCAAAAGATMLLPATLDEMWEAADVVVVGKVVGGVGRMDGRHGIVRTHLTIVVEEVLKGEVKGNAVHLVVPGGTDGEAWTEVQGAPDPGPPGGRVIAFLYADSEERLSNVVAWQGLFHLEGEKIKENGRDAKEFLEQVRGLGRRRHGGAR